MPESSGSIYSFILMLGNLWYYHFTWSGANLQEIVNLFQFSSGPWGPTIGWEFTISCEFDPLQLKWWCHVFWHEIREIHGIWASWHYLWKSSCQKYTAWVHGDPTPICFCNVMYFFWRDIQSLWNKLLHLSVFLVKQYTSLIYVKEKSFCLVNWTFPFVGPRGPFSCIKVPKIFYAYEGLIS